MDKQSIHPLKRIDIILAEDITDFAEKNDINFRQASGEFAKFIKMIVSNEKVERDITI